MYSVVILTYNEEINIAECIASVKYSDDIVVFDSFSTDKTIGIAKECGARIFQRKFDNYAAQRNAALNEVKFKYDWVLMLDADERVLQSLHEEIETNLNNLPEDITLFRMRRKDFFRNKWIKRSSGYPTWFGRLMKVGFVTIKREINEEYHTNGKIVFLQEHLVHYPFNKGLEFWFERHNRYSSMEAQRLCEEKYDNFQLGGLFSSDPVNRRKTLKQLGFIISFRPFLTFIYLYVIRLGFLDGAPGFTFCIMRSFYEFMIDIKVKEHSIKLLTENKSLSNG